MIKQKKRGEGEGEGEGRYDFMIRVQPLLVEEEKARI
jgi:hypothetical protein